ncbi:ImmA/IrrE family metallo-endopeptidase [Brucella intermedia]|uniref:ImmA/IrrE family metallo-endopeptidase n=1 Tax=Brucella intermedia TaxID=94625 RepID=UPI00165D1577|nr:ImmA/IrrE family metallo-endopeptidase [Brucella intermedia]MCO7736449.1 ImmA/IrrE family metallo-endopeptidase [Brucella intermedia]QNQ40045.1 ImmA/IrrE family metallo-endopeptidase [Brucella intermedia]
MTFAMHANDRPNRDGARAKARSLTKIYTTPPVPVVEIAEMNGVNVVFSDMGKFAEDVAGLIDFRAKRIYVNKADRPQRQRFTVAHELGHWILHREAFEQNPDAYPVLPRFQAVERSNAFEQEANAFASEILVPKHLLEPVSKAPVSMLADIFDVSKTMMEIRLQYA